MRIIGVVGEKLKYTIDVQWKWEDWNWKLKRLYLDWQTQEIYILGRNSDVCLKVNFIMSVTSSGMHPDKVNWHMINSDTLPKSVQMQMLMGAL